MRLPPGRARAFEAAGKQGCDCVSWSRKRRAGFVSRQGVYESPRSSSHAGLRDKMSRTCGHTHKKQTDFSLKIGMGGEAILGLCYLPDKWEVKFRPYIFLPRCIHDFLHKQTTLIFWYSQIYFRLNLRPMLFRWKFYFQRLAHTRCPHGFDKTLHHHLKTVVLMKFEKTVLLKNQ